MNAADVGDSGDIDEILSMFANLLHVGLLSRADIVENGFGELASPLFLRPEANQRCATGVESCSVKRRREVNDSAYCPENDPSRSNYCSSQPLEVHRPSTILWFSDNDVAIAEQIARALHSEADLSGDHIELEG